MASDNFRGTYELVVNHLIELGHQHIVHADTGYLNDLAADRTNASAVTIDALDDTELAACMLLNLGSIKPPVRS